MTALADCRPEYWSQHFTSLAAEESKSGEQQLDFSNQAVAVQTYSYMLEACGQLAGKRILDCGFGTGELARMCDMLGGIVEAFDLVATRLPKLAVEYPSVRWSSADLGNWQLPSQTERYDVVLACEVLQYVDFDVVIENLTQALTSNGRLIIFVPNADCEIVQRSTARFDNQYVGVTVQSLSERFSKYAGDFRVTYRGIRFQRDQSVVPYAADAWTTLFPVDETQAALDNTTPANRLQIVLSR